MEFKPHFRTRTRQILVPAEVASSGGRSAMLQLRRQILQLVTLIALAAAAFGVTRAVAASNREMNRQDGAEWYGRGQRALAERRLSDAIDAFRRAAARNRNDGQYALALAHALALNGDTEAARSALLTLRESSPEDVEINLQLARLAVDRNDVTEALRYYRAALYSPWPVEHPEARRAVRLELIRFLLAHRQLPLAESELIAFSGGMPDDPALHLATARLFVAAGDPSRALEQFQDTLRLAPDNPGAVTGAGRAAFSLRKYALAQRYLQRAPDGNDGVKREREIVNLVLSRDPLAERIGAIERRRRFQAVLDDAGQRLNACISARAPGSVGDEQALRAELDALIQQLPSRGPVEQDVIEAGMDVIRRIQTSVTADCGPATTLDSALRLIVEAHGGAGK